MQNFVDELTNMISILENKHNQRAKIYEWIEEENIILKKLMEKPTRINIDATAQEMVNLNEMLQNINEKKIESAELVSDDPSDKLVNDLDVLTDMVINLLIKYFHTHCRLLFPDVFILGIYVHVCTLKLWTYFIHSHLFNYILKIKNFELFLLF